MSEEKKKEVKVINVPKRKKPLATPSYIIRIAMIVCFVICILLLSSPFLSAKLYITKDLEITSSVSEAYREVATQEEVDNAEKELQNALNSLEKIEKTESSQAEVEENTVGLSSANYKWSCQRIINGHTRYRKGLTQVLLRSLSTRREIRIKGNIHQKVFRC